MTSEQENELGVAMELLARSENKRARQQWGGGNSGNRAFHQSNGSKGGRPKTGNKQPLTDRAATINRMMLRNIGLKDIADLLGTTHKSINDAKRRYGLPRIEAKT